jgi:hypothetical protein
MKKMNMLVIAYFGSQTRVEVKVTASYAQEAIRKAQARTPVKFTQDTEVWSVFGVRMN